MKWQQVVQLINRNVEYNIKFFNDVEKFDDLGAYMTAYANVEGGQIVIGVDIKNLHLTGTKQNKDWVKKHSEKYIKPSINYQIVEIKKDSKTLIVIKVKRSNQRPCYYKNLCYVLDKDSQKPRLAILENKFNPSQKSIVEIKKTEDKNKKESNSPTSKEKAIKNINKRQHEALGFLKKEQEIQNKTYRDLCKVSHKTAHLELVDLVTKGYIKQEGSGRSTKYVLKNNDGTKISFTTFH
ncbi:MAG: RNA-binding domain-containing protein [bacterium]